MSAMLRMVRDAFKIAALLIGVTLLGLVGGAGLMSPAFSPRQRMLAAGGVIGVLVTAALVAWLMGIVAHRRQRRGGVVPRVRRGARHAHTPRAVQALAASGAAPVDIAHRTRLPVDAVAMLLELAPAQ